MIENSCRKRSAIAMFFYVAFAFMFIACSDSSDSITSNNESGDNSPVSVNK
jgi:hypothetical protein